MNPRDHLLVKHHPSWARMTVVCLTLWTRSTYQPLTNDGCSLQLPPRPRCQTARQKSVHRADEALEALARLAHRQHDSKLSTIQSIPLDRWERQRPKQLSRPPMKPRHLLRRNRLLLVARNHHQPSRRLPAEPASQRMPGWRRMVVASEALRLYNRPWIRRGRSDRHNPA